MQYNVLSYLEEATHKYGDKMAFADADGGLSYNELLARARSIGSYIAKESGVRKRPVAILMDKSSRSIAAFMGVIYSGNFYCPIDEEMPLERMKKILSVLEPALMICDNQNMDSVRELGLTFVSYDAAANYEIDDELLNGISENIVDTDQAYALFTSGSTGFPKGVAVSHRAIIESSEWIAANLDITDKDIIGNQSPLYFDNSTLDIYSGIRNGCTVEIIPKELFAFPIKLMEYMDNKNITTISWVPSALCLVANMRALQKSKCESLNKIFFCGEVMPNKQLNAWRDAFPDAMFVNLYGMTEIVMNCTYYIVKDIFADDEPLPIGKPCSNTRVIILTEDDKEAAKGEIGEICIGGSGLALGYYNNQEQTDKAFVQNPLNRHFPEIIYRTGDMGRYGDDGNIMYSGRKDQQIKHKGYRIELGEIETAAARIENVETTACIYHEEAQRIIMFCRGDEPDKTDIKKVLKHELPEYMIPAKIFVIEEFPYNANGKIDRKTLKRQYIEGIYR